MDPLIDGPHRAARSTAVLVVVTALSPATGFLVEIALAWRFGAGSVVDAFRVSHLAILFGQQILVVSMLPNVIVPTFAACRARGRESDGWKASIALTLLLIVPISAVTLLLALRPEALLAVLGPDLTGETRSLALLFLPWFVGVWALFVVSGAAAGILFAHGFFWIPATGHALTNVFLVTALLTTPERLGPISLLIGILGGLLASTILLGGRALALPRPFRSIELLSLRPMPPEFRTAFRSLPPIILATVLMQGIAVILYRVLSGTPSGTLASMGYAWKFGQLVTILPMALSTVLFPRFATLWHAPDRTQFACLALKALRMGVFISVPLTSSLIALRHPFLTLMLERGAFGADAVNMTARHLSILLIAVPAVVASTFLQRLSYSLQAPWLPTAALGVGFLAMLGTAPAGAAHLGAEGAAAAFVGAHWITAGVLLHSLQRRQSLFHRHSLSSLVLISPPLGLASAWLGRAFGIEFGVLVGSESLSQLLTVVSGFGVAMGLYIATAYALGLPEATTSLHFCRWQAGSVIRRARVSST